MTTDVNTVCRELCDLSHRRWFPNKRLSSRPARARTHSGMQECAMTQPTQSAPEPNQQAVKDHVKAILRRLPRKPPRNEQARPSRD